SSHNGACARLNVVASDVCFDNRSNALRSRHSRLIRFMQAAFPLEGSLNLDHVVKELFITYLILLSLGAALTKSNPFKWRHYESEIILLCVRWYLRYALSYRDLEEMMEERNLTVDHTTIYRRVQRYAPELEKRSRPHLRPTNDSYRVDETYVKIKGQWYYLYRAVDSTGQTIGFMLSAKRDARAAKRFFRKMLKAPKHQCPRVINVDQNKAYPPAVEELKKEGVLPVTSQLRQC